MNFENIIYLPKKSSDGKSPTAPSIAERRLL